MWTEAFDRRRSRRPSGSAITLLGGLLCGCSASFGSGGPTVAAIPAVGERDPGRTDESLREQRLRDVLQALFRAEQRYHNETGTYTDEVYALRGDGGSGSAFRAPAGVRLRIPEATPTGFSAVAGQAPHECALYVGDSSPPRSYVSTPSVIGCR